jgi:hypothetical protein
LEKRLTDWIGIDAGFTPVGLSGFVYLVVNLLTNQKYIGKKYFSSRLRKKIPGKKRRKLCIKESDWRYYKSSSDDLKADIAKYGEASFQFTILETFKTRAQVNYAEIRWLFVKDVLYSRLPSGEFEFYNKCILNRYYRGKI